PGAEGKNYRAPFQNLTYLGKASVHCCLTSSSPAATVGENLVASRHEFLEYKLPENGPTGRHAANSPNAEELQILRVVRAAPRDSVARRNAHLDVTYTALTELHNIVNKSTI